MTQVEWSAELADELYREHGLEITVSQVLDALGSCGLQLVPGDEASTAFWQSLKKQVPLTRQDKDAFWDVLIDGGAI